MSVPIAVTGLKPKIKIRIGVIREPPPTPVRPTRIPTPNPKRITSGSMPRRLGRRRLAGEGLDQHVGDLGPGELLRRPLATTQQLAHLGAGQEDAVLGPRGRGLGGGHPLRDLAPEGVLELERLDAQLAWLELVEDVLGVVG